MKLMREEKALFALRELYEGHGYRRFQMSRFEEYRLYVQNKDFLVSDQVITFTDPSGKLMALKPDVTLSIIKNAADEPGKVQKLYYHENVYRPNGAMGSFKEIMQAGLECVGDLSAYDVAEVAYLAAKSLQSLLEAVIDPRNAATVARAALCEYFGTSFFGAINQTDADAEEKLNALREKLVEAQKIWERKGLPAAFAFLPPR